MRIQIIYYKNTNNFDCKKARNKEEKGLHSTATGKSRILLRSAKFLQSNQMFQRIIKIHWEEVLEISNKHCIFDQNPCDEVTNRQG